MLLSINMPPQVKSKGKSYITLQYIDESLTIQPRRLPPRRPVPRLGRSHFHYPKNRSVEEKEESGYKDFKEQY